MNSNKIPCPICGKSFTSNIIESHASKCLFLNEPGKNETVFKDSSPITKRHQLKVTPVKKSNQTGIKRKSLSDQASSFESFQKYEDGKNNVTSEKSVIIVAVFDNRLKKIILYNI